MLLTTKKLILTMTAAFGLASFAAPVLSQSTAPSAKTAASSTAKKTSAGKGKAVKTTAKRTTKKASAKRTSIKKNAKKTKKARRAKRRTGSSPSQATLAGLRKTADPLLLGSSVAYAVDQDTGEELVVKNADVPLPIASVTKLMTALVIAESDLPLDEKVRITREDYVRSNAYSKLTNGMVMTREALLKAALMSSDNRAAHALARSYPGGKKQFIARMNETAAELGMTDSFFADPTGLDNRNHSTARDLGKLVAAVYEYQEIRTASTAPMAKLRAGRRTVSLKTTNRLIGDPSWRIGIQKTGFTTAAGRCMVVQSEVGDRRLVMVVLDSPDNAQRANDMRTMRAFVEMEETFAKDFSNTRPYELF
ncbi:serine hydrolase [Sutterella massiliensis]|uniref:Serine hydrolase n=1 Tax=Sutterella massiliensis TaxID=1816689 RepID=A0ABS2DP93_9BURK|nr:serine hydrolase [Sutterella massiliensis]MBM6703174.1 serine hydrolase [Sutterella massiliensis]